MQEAGEGDAAVDWDVWHFHFENSKSFVFVFVFLKDNMEKYNDVQSKFNFFFFYNEVVVQPLKVVLVSRRFQSQDCLRVTVRSL